MYFETETELSDMLFSQRRVKDKLDEIASKWEYSWLLIMSWILLTILS